MSKWRKLTWVILAWNVLMVVWLVTGLASTTDTCEGVEFQEACQSGADVGTAIGVGFILFVAAAGDVILGVIWFVTNRPNGSTGSAGGRRCPHCAEQIQWQAKVCKHCGRDVDAAVAPGGCQECGAPPVHPPTPKCLNCGAVRV